MPLTIAHPAAILPFRRSSLPLSALVIGSLAPDMEYFVHLAPQSDFSHTITGLFAFCLPVGLIALWIFHRIWKPPLVAILGEGHGHHATLFSFGPVSRFIILCCEILVGALIHMIWDSFTHDYGWLVQNMPEMNRPVLIMGGGAVPFFKLLYHVSNLVGCAVLVFIAFYHRTWTWNAFVSSWRLLVVVGWISVAGGIALGMLVAGDVSNAEGLRRWVGCAQVVGSAVLVLVTTFLCLVWHVRQRMARRAAQY